LQNLAQEHPFTLQWARLFYLHGEGQNPNSLLAALDRAIDAGDAQFNMSMGDQLRDYLEITEAAAQLATLIARPDVGGVINCAVASLYPCARWSRRAARARSSII
jgi:dTDP-6-deoxy-L-talose 4-dehydrogenase (NAD+)